MSGVLRDRLYRRRPTVLLGAPLSVAVRPSLVGGHSFRQIQARGGGAKTSGIPDSLDGFFMTPRNGIRLQSEGQLVGIPVCSCLFGPLFHLRNLRIRRFAVAQHKVGSEVNQLNIGGHQ